MQAPVIHVNGLTSIVRERLLPVPGTVLARLNQKVSALDVVAQTSWAREHLLLDVTRILRVTSNVADRLITCNVGDRIAVGAVITAGKGLFSRRVRAPRDGRVVAVGGGKVLMEVGVTKVELRAGIPGTVVQVLPNHGVVIQTAGALIQGVWGNGRIASGTLVNLAEKPDGILTVGRLDVSLRGSIILAGIVNDVETLQAAAGLPVRGLILSSILPSLIQKAMEMRYPILVTDGFGSLPMNSAAYKLLITNARRDVTVNAEIHDRYSGARPEVIIPLPISEIPLIPREVETFAPGLQVRMRLSPALGMIGSIVALKSGLTRLPSGLQAPAAEVKLENGETVIVPLVNLEFMG
ncbi:MAG TPA: hypothetical protein VJL10_10005 [Anaerolineales bacterium]|nr:hypothetical protein [Anaerolineales bacterium]